MHAELDIVYSVHLNPKVRETVYARLGGTRNIFLLPPLDYVCFVYLMSRCHLVLTDSGGIQEEAPTLDKPVLVMRDTTERPEVVESGAGQLVTTTAARIVDTTHRVLTDTALYADMASAANPFGDGTAAQKITAILTV